MMRACSVFAFLLCSAAAAWAQPFTTHAVAEGVYAFEPHARLDEVDGNSILIVGRTAAMIVDTNTSPASARAVLAEVRRLTSKPIAFIVNTHWHYDHVFGNQVYKEAFPAAQIIAHQETARIGRTWAQYYTARMAKGLPSARDSLRLQMATGNTAQGQALTPFERRLVEAQLAGFDRFAQKITDARYLLPDVTFRDALTVDLGDRPVRLMNFGRGNTPGDVVAYVPDARVLATGDLVVHPTPYGIYSYPASWIDVMKRVAEIDAAAIVPGHGPVMRDASYVSLLIDLLTSVVDQVRACVAANMTLEQTRAKVDMERFRRQLAGDDELKNWTFHQNWERPVVERAWREARGEF